ncbi:nuclear transport factor 2 family protein [Sphingobacterium chuzhouense]|uniref:Nuclear transport factor 2 family protein n=1 Tax=Sphingobacterium chuzhouense TaxID=1742264 RepID=A0ABR7XT96_9SPHI|nr:nuclear transport factor 2 family protein [Sphingobacterium chuzhouense]MBD1422386.1 nuclear transport factor 2 family protein [Sphingobacterium chuzhouense]
MTLYNKVSLVMLTIVMATILSETSAQEKRSLQEEVENATKALTEAMLKPTAQVLNKLTSDKLSYGHSSGTIETKEQFVNTLVSGASVFEEIQISEQTVYLQDNTAIVRHTLNAKTNDPGKGPASIRLGIMLTWVKSNGSWQLLARQAFKL